MDRLEDRSEAILRTIVAEYVCSGEPVGLVFRDAIQEFTDHLDEVKPVLRAFLVEQ